MAVRIQRLLEKLPADFGAALVTGAVSRFYLLDFDSGDAGTLLVFPEQSYFIIDSRYIEVAQRDVHGAEVILQGDVSAQVRGLLQKNGTTHLLMEQTATIAEFETWREALAPLVPDASPVLSTALADCRKIKDAQEWKDICTAQSITDAAFEYILTRLAPGRTELELAAELEFFMRKNGAGKMAFETILISGTKTSMPHGVPGAEVLKKGDFVTMDYGANYHGYCSDMTRTVAIGQPSEEMRAVYAIVLQAQLACCAAVRPGQKGCEVDKIARDIIYSAGYEGCFGHGLGHSLGIEIHENPRYSMQCTELVEAGTVMTVEPGIYLAGRFGVRIEDTVLVTPQGAKIPGKSSKELIVL